MSIEERLAAAKAAREAKDKEQQNATEQEVDAERLKQEAAFLETYKKRATLQQAFDDLRAAHAELQVARGSRRQDFRTIQGAVTELNTELKSLDGDEAEEVTVREAITEPKEGTIEEQYVQSRQGVETAIANMRDKKQVLADLVGGGIEGFSDEEMQQAVNRVRQEAGSELRSFVREHPDSELPEAKEIKAEIIEGLVKEILVGEIAIRDFVKAVGQGTKEFQRQNIREGNFENLNADQAKRLRRSLTQKILQRVALSEGFEGLVRNSRAVAGDQFAAPAIAEALKQTLFNYKKNPNGAIEYRNSTYSYYIDTYADSPMSIAKIRDASLDMEPIPDEYFYLDEPSGEKSELKRTVGPLLAETLDPQELEKFSEQVVELASIQETLAALPMKRDALVAKVREVDAARAQIRRIEGDLTSLDNGLSQGEQYLSQQEMSIARLALIGSSQEEFASRIMVSDVRGERSIKIQAFEDAVSRVAAKMAERKRALAGTADEAEQGYRRAKREYDAVKDKLLNFKKGELKGAMETALAAWEKARQNKEDITRDTEFIALQREEGKLLTRYRVAATEIERGLGGVAVPRDVFGWQGIAGLKEALEGERQRQAQRVQDLAFDKAKNNDERKSLEERIALLNGELHEATGYVSPSEESVTQAVDNIKADSQRRADSLKKSMRGE